MARVTGVVAAPGWPAAPGRSRLVGLWRRTRRWLRRLRPTRTWADPLGLTRRLLHRALAQRAGHARGCMLDLGCGLQPYRDLFRQVDRYVAVDQSHCPHLDARADALSLPFRAEAFDTVLCNQVLEHVPEAGLLMGEIARVLRPGGTLLMTAPLTWGLHLEPNDFYRYTCYGLRYLAERCGLRVIEVAPTCGLWATIAQRVVDTVIHTYGTRWPWWLVECAAILLAPVLLVGGLLNRLSCKRGDTLDYVMVAKRP